MLRQTAGKPQVRYLILGLALVSGWEAGYFYLEGFSRAGLAHGQGPQTEIDALLATQPALVAANADLPPADGLAGRVSILASILRRRGQSAFRTYLLEAYDGHCAFSNYDLPDALEAAHIVPYHQTRTNHPTNGLLLRADLHTLFDLGLVAVDAPSMTVLLAPRLQTSAYRSLQGMPVRLPADPHQRPSLEALAQHRRWANL